MLQVNKIRKTCLLIEVLTHSFNTLSVANISVSVYFSVVKEQDFLKDTGRVLTKLVSFILSIITWEMDLY